MKKIFTSFLATVFFYAPTLAVQTAPNEPLTDIVENPAYILDAIGKVNYDGYGLIPLYEGYSTVVYFYNTCITDFAWDNYYLKVPATETYASIVCRADDWCFYEDGTSKTIPTYDGTNAYTANGSQTATVGFNWDTWHSSSAPGNTAVIATVTDNLLTLKVIFHDLTNEIYNIYYPTSVPVPVDGFYLGGGYNVVEIERISFVKDEENAVYYDATKFTDRPDGLITKTQTFDPPIQVLGHNQWNTKGSGITFPITENAVTVNITNSPFIRDTGNGSQFIFETVSSSVADGITLRADAAGWTYTYVANTYVNTPTFTVTYSWEWGTNYATFIEMCKSHTEVSITAQKTGTNTVIFNVVFADESGNVGGTEVYTVTYPSSVPNDLEFRVGADGGNIQINSVVFTGEDIEGNEKPNAISNVKADADAVEVARYNVLGQRIIAPQRGINIIKYSDGSTKKVLVK